MLVQQTQNICITCIQCWTNVEDAGPTLYKCYTNVLRLLRILYTFVYWEQFVTLSGIALWIFINVLHIPYGKLLFCRHYVYILYYKIKCLFTEVTYKAIFAQVVPLARWSPERNVCFLRWSEIEVRLYQSTVSQSLRLFKSYQAGTRKRQDLWIFFWAQEKIIQILQSHFPRHRHVQVIFTYFTVIQNGCHRSTS